MSGVVFDPGKAREWLRSPSPDVEGCTVAQEIGVEDDSGFGYCCGDFIDPLERLVSAAAVGGVFGPDWEMALWLVRDSDGTCDGALVTLTTHAREDGGRVRLAGLHTEFRYLTTDREATGEAGAVALLEGVAYAAQDVLDEAGRLLWVDAVSVPHPVSGPLVAAVREALLGNGDLPDAAAALADAVEAPLAAT